MHNRTIAPVVAGLRYFLPVFAFAFVLGIVRTLVLAPRFGDVIAVCIELPLVLGFAWVICRHIVRRVPPGLAGRVTMGATAFAMLLTVEFVMATMIFGGTAADWFAGFATLAGRIGLAGQVGFGLMPILVRR
jgi:hypothetical protein